MHKTLKAETANPPRKSFRCQQQSFDDFLQEHNFVRPHEAIGQKVPAKLYEHSKRKYPERLPELEYPEHFHIAKAYPNGCISFRATQWYVSNCVENELIGIEEINNDCYKVFFGNVLLGIMDLRHSKERGYRQFGLLKTDAAATMKKNLF